eukprot:1482311-Pyramimonas_sp.AAC.1
MPSRSPTFRLAMQSHRYTVTSLYESSCATYGKDALNTPDGTQSHRYVYDCGRCYTPRLAR